MSGLLSDHNGYFPYINPYNFSCGYDCVTNSGSWSGSPNWIRRLAAYLSPPDTYSALSAAGLPVYYTSPAYSKLLQCQANDWPWPTDPNSYWGVWGMPPTSYILNGNMFPNDISVISGAFPPVMNSEYIPWLPRVQLANISHPSGLALVGEIPYDASAANAYGGALPGNGPNYISFNNLSWTSEALGPFPGNGAVYWKQADCSNINSCFHNLGVNVLYVDGHVERLSKSTLFKITDPLSQSGTMPCCCWTGGSSPGNIFWQDGMLGCGWGAPPFGGTYPTAPWPTDP
jgi:prepilin-type processing-associated H-X9-DG protein